MRRHRNAPYLSDDGNFDEDAHSLTTGPGRAALMRTVSLLEQLQITNTFQVSEQDTCLVRKMDAVAT